MLRRRGSEMRKAMGCRWTTVSVDMRGSLSAGASLGKQQCAHTNGQEAELNKWEHDEV
jgi:hypothetical protein